MSHFCPHCQAPIRSAQEFCSMCQQALAETPPALGASAPSKEVSEHIKIVQNFSRHKSEKVSVPSSVEALKSKLQRVPANGRVANGNRFRTDAETAATAQTGEQFLERYAEAHRLIEAADFRAALELLAHLIEEATPERVAECQSLRGYLFLQKLDFEKAEAECSKALRLQPTDAQTYAWRAAAYGEQDRWREAFDDLALACEFGGTRRDEFEALVQSYAQAATEFFRQQVSSGQPSANVVFDRGWMFYRLGKTDKAIRDFQQAIKIAPLHPWASAGLAMLAADDEVSALTLPFEALDELCEVGFHGERACQQVSLAIQARLCQRNDELTRAEACCQQLLGVAGDDPISLHQCAQLQLDLNHPIDAINTLNKLLDAHPKFAVAWLLRGDCFFAVRDDGRAVEDYSEHLRLRPDDTTALVRRAAAELRRGNHDLAMDDLDVALQLDENNFDAWLKRGEVAVAAGDLNEAMTACQRAKSLNNRRADVYVLLGSVHQQMGDYSRAAEEYSRSVDFAKTPADKASNLYHRGIQWYELREFEKAADDFTQSLNHRPDHAGTLIWRAAAFSRNDNLSSAISDLQEAIAIRPSSADHYRKLGQSIADRAVGFFTRRLQRGRDEAVTYYNRGQAHHFLANYDGAVTDYTAAIDRKPTDVAALIARGHALRNLSNYGAAADDFSTAIGLEPASHLAYFGRAAALFEQGRVEAAARDIQEALKGAPRRARYHTLAAEIAGRADDATAQLASLTQAIALDDTDPTLYVNRAIAYEAAEQMDQAMRDLTRSLELEPNQSTALQRRGNLALKLGQPKQAIDDFGRSLAINPLSLASWAARARAFVANDQHQEGLICLTKAMHRFNRPQDLAQIVFARGKLYQQAGRLAPAATDYGVAVDLLVDHTRERIVAIRARGIALAQLKQFDAALEDFLLLKKNHWGDPAEIDVALAWLKNPVPPCPAAFEPATTMIRPTRPPIISYPEPHWLPGSSFELPPPHDQWIVQLEAEREFGPVRYDVLLLWIREGRLNGQSRLLRSDWDRWRKLSRVFPTVFQNQQPTFPKMRELPS